MATIKMCVRSDLTQAMSGINVARSLRGVILEFEEKGTVYVSKNTPFNLQVAERLGCKVGWSWHKDWLLPIPTCTSKEETQFAFDNELISADEYFMQIKKLNNKEDSHAFN